MQVRSKERGLHLRPAVGILIVVTSGPILSRSEIRAVDQRAIDQLGMPGLVLMENAGRGAAERILADAPPCARCCILCGPGNNGGDGYVVARQLAIADLTPTVVHLAPPERSRGDAGVMRKIVARLQIPSLDAWNADSTLPEPSFDLYVDALLGTGFTGEPRDPIARAIRWMNEREGRKVSLDLPSGLDCDSGLAADPTVIADRTLTFAAQKQGLVAPGASEWTGSVEIIPIGLPESFVRDSGAP